MKTEVIKVHPQYPEPDRIARCAKVIRQGGLVIFPTETVYGIAADFNNPKAIARLREVKKRSDDKPFSILISQKGLISNYTSAGEPVVYKFIDQYWPGPLTVIVPARSGSATIGIRMPDHVIALKLVQEAQCTIAAPSANVEGAPPPKTCEEALKDLNGLVDMAIDGGEAKYGQSSSVIDFTKPKPVLVREGAILQGDLDRLAKTKTILFVCTGNSCRSVMAEYLLKKLVKGRADVEVVSAGTGVFLQSTASFETVAVLQEEGIDAREHLSQPINTILLKKADLIIVMTRAHRDQVLERVPGVEKRVYLLKEFVDAPAMVELNMDVPDPIGQPRSAYKDCLTVIKQAIHKIRDLV